MPYLYDGRIPLLGKFVVKVRVTPIRSTNRRLWDTLHTLPKHVLLTSLTIMLIAIGTLSYALARSLPVHTVHEQHVAAIPGSGGTPSQPSTTVQLPVTQQPAQTPSAAAPPKAAVAPIVQAPAPQLPAVAGKDTSYNLGILVIKYFPLTSDGQSIDMTVTGDIGGSYASVRQHTVDITNGLLTFLPKATRYLGYKYGGDQPAINYRVVATLEHTAAVPIDATIHSGHPTYPDYYGIMSSHNICGYVDGQGVHEVWLFAYQGPNKPGQNYPYLDIEESKMSGPFGDISNSYRWDDMPHCNHTYVVYTFNDGRGTAEAMHSWGHQIESEMNAVDSNLFGLFQGPSHPQTLGVAGRCGSVHNPPNARFEYDWANPTPQLSDCEDWQPDSLGATTQISCAVWGCNDISDTNNAQLNYMVWMWQNLPGRNNTKAYQGKSLRNWWDVHGDFDTVMGSSRRLTL